MRRMGGRAALVVLAAAAVFGPLPAAMADGSHRWSIQIGSPEGSDLVADVAADSSGNVFVTGQMSGTVDFGGITLISAGSADIFLAKYTHTGALVWAKRFGSSGFDAGVGVAVDSAGAVILAATFQGTVGFGGPGFVSQGASDVAVVKYSSSGGYLWARAGGGSGADGVSAVDTDAANNVLITGFFTGTASFGGAALAGQGGFDVYVAKYNQGAGHIWSSAYGGPGSDNGVAIASGPGDAVVVAGVFQGSASFGGAPLASAGGSDVFVARYDGGGSHVWSARHGGVGSETVGDVAVDALGEIVLAGGFNGSASFGGAALTSAGMDDIVLAKYTSAGSHVWSQRFGSPGGEQAAGLEPDASSTVILVASFSGSASFGGSLLTSSGGADVALARYSASGGHMWSRRLGGGAADDLAQGVTSDANGNITAGGRFSGTASLGGAILTSLGSDDGWLAGYTSRAPDVQLAESGGVTAVAEGGATDTYTVQLATQPVAPVAVSPSNAAGQVTTLPASLTFTEANWNVPQVVTVRAVDDAVDEPATHVTTLTHAASSADRLYNGIPIGSLTISIADNDTAGMTLAQSGGSTAVTEGGPPDVYTIVLKSQPTSTVTVSRNVSDGQATVSPPVLTFTPANWNVPQGFIVTATDDALIEPPHMTTISHSVSSADPLYHGFVLPPVTVTVHDNDVAGITIVQPGGSTEVTEGGATDTYTIALTAQPIADVVITPSNAEGQVSVSPPSVTFAPGAWNVPQTITVTAVNDATLEPYQSTTTITHSSSSTDPNFNALSLPSVVVTVTDNDDASPPASTWTTANLSILRIPPLGNDKVSGFSTDASSGVASVVISYAPLAGSVVFVNATLTCSTPERLHCAWTAGLPSTPGLYTARAMATDRKGNVELPGPMIQIVVI